MKLRCNNNSNESFEEIFSNPVLGEEGGGGGFYFKN